MSGQVEAYLRVNRYLDRLEVHKHLDQNNIHGLDVGTEHEAILTTADLETLLDMAPACIINAARRHQEGAG